MLRLLAAGLCACVSLRAAPVADPRNLEAGWPLPSESGYCDQPYVVITKEGHWLCVLTTGRSAEGDPGQHVVSTISRDQGRTWSALTDIEPADGPQASWAVPLVTPGGRIYVFYDYNGDRIGTLRGKSVRVDMLGWYVFKYSDDHGRTWSAQRQRLPVRLTACDRGNDWQGAVQLFWGIDKPKIADGAVMFGFTKLGRHLLDQGEGWFFRSENLLTESDATKLSWQMLPDGDHGLRAPSFGWIQEEFNTVPLGSNRWYCIFRTTNGFCGQAYSHDGGKTWTPPEPATYTPGGRFLKHPRACPKLWKTAGGRYLLWFHNHGGRSFADRNPAWICGGVEKNGRLWWSPPEILLYDTAISNRISYPDLIEQGGKYWISETQKKIARIHEIDPTLLEGLWNPAQAAPAGRRPPVISLSGDALKARELAAPRLPPLTEGAGFTLDLRVRLETLGPDQVILDTRDERGRGIAVVTTADGTVQLRLSDGHTGAAWDCDPGLLQAGRVHSIGIVVDAGPRLITFVVDGAVCDGGAIRQYGWGRFPPALTDVNSAARLRWGPSLRALRVHDQALRHAELVR